MSEGRLRLEFDTFESPLHTGELVPACLGDKHYLLELGGKRSLLGK